MLLFLLTTLEKDNDLNRKLRSALSFYRENKDLINMLRGAMENGQPEPPSSGSEQERKGEKQESRPSEGRADSMKILEEYLKRSAV